MGKEKIKCKENGALGTFLQGLHDQLKRVTDLVISHIH